MTSTATYLSDLGRVRIAFTGAPAGADYAVIEKSLDGITWTTVRGGDTVPIVSNAGKLDDYEFAAGLLNTYRVTYHDTGLVPTLIGAGALATGNNTSVLAAHPAGLAVGHWKLVLASIRNSGTGVPVQPTGWTTVAQSGNFALFGRVHQAGDTAPTIAFTGGAAGADTMAQMSGLSSSKGLAASVGTQLNGSSQNVDGPLTLQVGLTTAIGMGWKQSSFTSSTTPSFATKIADCNSTAGSGASMFWDAWAIPLANDGVPFDPWPITITGGSAAISRAMVIFVPPPDNVGVDTVTITPTLTSAWLKVPSRPSLNIPVTISWDGKVSRPARTGVFDVLGRTNPVAVTDVQGSRRLTLMLITQSISEADDLDQRLSTGDPIFIQAPTPHASVPTLYAVVGDVDQDRPANRAKRRYFTVPLIEVAAPGATVYSDTYVWADVVSDYATWSDVISGVATWSDLIDKISNNEVIVT